MIPKARQVAQSGRRHAERYAGRVGIPFALSRKFFLKKSPTPGRKFKKKAPACGRFLGSGTGRIRSKF
jgi:hypothetical protein